jgi:hypothetical protein
MKDTENKLVEIFYHIDLFIENFDDILRKIND